MSTVFRTDGPLREEESHLYVERAEDRQILVDIRRGRYVTLLGARQTGKTSLLFRLRRHLLDDGHFPVYLDLSSVRDVTAESWYRYLTSVLEVELEEEIGVGGVPLTRDRFEFRQALRQMSRDLPPSRRVVILLDDVSGLHPGISESFFSTIRAIFNEREASRELQRYAFVMAGAFIPDDLVQDSARSPFKVASRIYTSDADPDEIASLVGNLMKAGHSLSDDVADRIYHWTNGHVYLTQRICSLLERREEVRITGRLVGEAVDAVLNSKTIRRICDEVQGSPERDQALCRILTGAEPLRFNRASRVIAELELVGVIRSDEHGYCAVRNEIYRKALVRRYLDSNSDDAGGDPACTLPIRTTWSRKVNG